MEAIVFKSSYQDTLTIKGIELKVTNSFGDTYSGQINASNNVETKSRIGLGYLSRAYYEFKRSNNNNFLTRNVSI